MSTVMHDESSEGRSLRNGTPGSDLSALVTPSYASSVALGGLGGLAAGAVAGIIAGPVGMLAGGLLGIAIGAASGAAAGMDLRERRLAEEFVDRLTLPSEEQIYEPSSASDALTTIDGVGGQPMRD
jgi:hypothetical protein